MADADERLRQATVALEEGQKGEARELLRQVLAQDSENEEAWLLMSRAASTNRQRLMCLEAMFDINRGNEAPPVDKARDLGRYQTAGVGKERRPGVRLASAILVVAVLCLVGAVVVMVSDVFERGAAVEFEGASAVRNTPISTQRIPASPTPQPSPTPTVDTCTIENRATRQYLAGTVRALEEVGQAFECATERGAIGSEVTPCLEQLLETRSEFRELWHPDCAGTHRQAMLAFLDEAVSVVEAARDGDEEAFYAHAANLEPLKDAAQRETEKLERALK